MGRVLRGHVLNTLITQAGQINATPQAFTRAKKDRRYGDMQFIYQAGKQILPDCAHTTA